MSTSSTLRVFNSLLSDRLCEVVAQSKSILVRSRSSPALCVDSPTESPHRSAPLSNPPHSTISLMSCPRPKRTPTLKRCHIPSTRADGVSLQGEDSNAKVQLSSAIGKAGLPGPFGCTGPVLAWLSVNVRPGTLDISTGRARLATMACRCASKLDARAGGRPVPDAAACDFQRGSLDYMDRAQSRSPADGPCDNTHSMSGGRDRITRVVGPFVLDGALARLRSALVVPYVSRRRADVDVG